MPPTNVALFLQKYIFERMQKEKDILAFFDQYTTWFYPKRWDLGNGGDSYFWFGMSCEYSGVCESLDISKINRNDLFDNIANSPSTIEINFPIDTVIQNTNFKLPSDEIYKEFKSLFETNSLLISKGFVLIPDGITLPFKLDLCEIGREFPNISQSLLALDSTLDTILEYIDELDKICKKLITL